MLPRFFLESPPDGDRATLAGAEAHHLLHVLRAKRGDRVTLFDGSGWEFQAVVEQLGRREVELIVIGRQCISRELNVPLTLGVSLPKGDRQKWLVEKLVELGVQTLVPLETRYSVAQPTGNTLERLRRAVVEASKQCGRNRLMAVCEPRPLEDFLRWPSGEVGAQGRCWLAHPGSMSWGELLAAVKRPSTSGGFWLAIGPEGGFTTAEVAHAVSAGWSAVDLGPRILRVETAAALLAALAQVVAAIASPPA